MTGQKILIADDDKKLIQMLAVQLRREGYQVISVQDGYQALDFACREEPDLLLLDVNMPAGDGFSVQERLLKMPRFATIPVIYLTGERSDRVTNSSSDVGAFAVIHKPFEMPQLLEKVRAALGQAGPVTGSDDGCEQAA